MLVPALYAVSVLAAVLSSIFIGPALHQPPLTLNLTPETPFSKIYGHQKHTIAWASAQNAPHGDVTDVEE